ncbi:hypothetical protein NDS46_31005 (plasmid) [Paenibacillus thiaminolyticus]|uniref:hypothetical protein n=1 Tax=Paenibacillus thiaminolyticus TaxID=49283 RepID=UPI0023301C6F|nr:hypothetical protein [Paenibacillus thiaminolyticus]WCF11390.1 hypothetical protein NDS46_31005 [Paenibacillus thiaminolyticus]
MKKTKRLLLGRLLLITLGFGIATTLFNLPVSYAALGGGNSQWLSTEYRDDGNGTKVREVDEPPTYITFNNGTAQKKWYDARGITKFWEQYHVNKFLWYSPIESTPAHQKNSNLDHSVIYENNLERPNLDYEWLAINTSKGLFQNLKLGSMKEGTPSRDNYKGDWTGTTTITNNSGRLAQFFGKNMEWRYLGYATNGVIIDNPLFPPDYPTNTAADWKPLEKNWWRTPWLETDGHPKKTERGPYDYSIDENKEVFLTKVQWFIKYLFPAHPELRRPEMDLWSDAADWAMKFTLKNNPDHSAGVITGWHGSGYYVTYTMESPKRNNLRVIEYKATDKETGKVVGLMTADANDNTNIWRKWEINNQEVAVGDTLVITAKVKNMKQDNFQGRGTRYTPIRMMRMAAFDEDSLILGKWSTDISEDIIPSINLNPATAISSIPYGGSIEFDKIKNDATGEVLQWEFKVPSNVKEQFVLGAEISEGFKKYNDNIYTGDDDGRLRFKIKEEDIGLVCSSIQLLDYQGNPTNEVTPTQSHGFRITVKKTKGNKLVGDPNDYYNPFAAIEATLNDGANVYISHEKSATKSLTYEGDTAVIEVKNAIVPSVPTIKADFKIHWFNASPNFGNQSSDSSNDSCSKVWRSTNNFSISNFNIVPSSVLGPNSILNENLTFEFIANSINPENADKDVKIEIRDQNGKIVIEKTVTLPANAEYPISWTVPNVRLNASTNGTINPFTVEINPPPRKYIESSPDTTNPYLDNIATSSVMAYKTDVGTPTDCRVVHTRNDWTETHYLHERHGYRYYWWHDVEGGGHYDSACRTTSDSQWTETKSYYEEYKITNVMFRSKLTRDTLGGDGWVDILAHPDKAKVKAGYGFEIKYIVKFNTNTYSASPKGWPGDCSFKTVYREYNGTVTAPKTLYVKMPFKDAYGNHVKYTLDSPTQSGNWDALTQTYEMPYHNAFNLKNTREVFVNESAKDGYYDIKINTSPYFYGSSYKPATSKYLCDEKTLTIRVIGANSDDVKTHVTQ